MSISTPLYYIEIVVEEVTSRDWHDLEESVSRGLNSFVHGLSGIDIGVCRHEVWNFPNVSTSTYNCVTNDVIELVLVRGPSSVTFRPLMQNFPASSMHVTHFRHVQNVFVPVVLPGAGFGWFFFSRSLSSFIGTLLSFSTFGLHVHIRP